MSTPLGNIEDALNIFQVTVENKDVEGLRWLDQNTPFSTFSQKQQKQLAIVAASLGAVEVLSWIKGKDFVMDADIFAAAAEKGHIEVLQWLYEDLEALPAGIERSVGKGGNLAVVEWISGLPGFSFSTAFLNGACSSGNMDMVEWALNKGLSFNSESYAAAAIGGNVEILERVIASGVKRDTSQNLAQIALSNGNGAMFQFVCEKFNYQIGPSALKNMLEGMVKKGAYSSGMASAFAALRDRGCLGHELVLSYVASVRSTVADLEACQAQGFRAEDAPIKAFVLPGDPHGKEKLEWMMQNGASCTVDFLQEMIPKGDMDMIAHAIRLGFPAEPSLYIHAAWANRLDMYPLLEERGVEMPYSSDSMRLLLQGKEPRGGWFGWDWHWWWWRPFWIHNTNPWNVPPFVVQALKIFHERGLAFPDDLFHMCLNVCRSDELFDYLLEAGAPFDQDAIKTARNRGLTELASKMENQSVF